MIKAFILYDKVRERDGVFNINESVLLNFLLCDLCTVGWTVFHADMKKPNDSNCF